MGVPVNAVLLFTDGVAPGTVDLTIEDIAEISITNPGVNVPDGTFTFVLGISDGTVDFVDANADKKVQIGELTVVLAGAAMISGETATITADAFTACTASTKGNALKSATKIKCDDVTDVDSKVTVETRPSPGKGHKHTGTVHKPTFCSNGEKLFLNDGAQAILLDINGDVVFSTFGTPVPIVLDETDPIEIIVSQSGSIHFDCNGEHREGIH